MKKVNVDFWGPHDLVFLFGSVYMAIPICKKIKKIWILYLYSKIEFIDIFQIWFLKVEKELNCIIKVFYTDGGKEFIFVKLKTFYKKTFYKKRGIIFKYIALYIHKKNSFVEKRWKTIISIKDVLLFDSRFLLDF